jgi:predicted dithiol-disulfide oxidoreductase (DUF899 family)
MHDKRFPGETPEYRTARNALLEAERDLRRHVEKVAAQRRELPLGPRVPQDYRFVEGGTDPADVTTSRPVQMSELFAPGDGTSPASPERGRNQKDTLVLYNFMYGPKAKEACPMCTAMLDALEGNAEHIAQRVNLAVVAKSPIGRIREYARGRGWRRLRLLSSGENDFNRDYFGENAEGAQNTMMHVFVKRADGIHLFWSSELNLIPPDPGQNQRHVDAMWPLWNVLDLTPEGRGKDWFPKLSY